MPAVHKLSFMHLPRTVKQEGGHSYLSWILVAVGRFLSFLLHFSFSRGGMPVSALAWRVDRTRKGKERDSRRRPTTAVRRGRKKGKEKFEGKGKGGKERRTQER